MTFEIAIGPTLTFVLWALLCGAVIIFAAVGCCLQRSAGNAECRIQRRRKP